MQFFRYTLEDCHQATGLVVVIDVLRAFSTAAYAFAAGARESILVADVAEALELRRRYPGSLAMGEVEGKPVEGFDFSNSPSDLLGKDLQGRLMIHRTSSGTQGVVRSLGASHLVASSFCVASATVRRILSLAPSSVSFILTGVRPELKESDHEDSACADYLEALLRGLSPPAEPYLQRVRRSRNGQFFLGSFRTEFPAQDLTLCTALDRFNFAMPVRRQGGLHILTPER